MVHAQDTDVALGAVMAPVGFYNLTDIAPPRAAVALADADGRHGALEGVVYDVDAGAGGAVAEDGAWGGTRCGRKVDAEVVAMDRGVVGWDGNDVVVFVLWRVA